MAKRQKKKDETKVEITVEPGIPDSTVTNTFTSLGAFVFEQQKENREFLNSIAQVGASLVDLSMTDSIRETMESIGKSLVDPVYENLGKLALETTLPTSRMIQDLMKDLDIARSLVGSYDFLVQPSTGIESARLNSGIANIERKIDALVPQIRKDPPPSSMTPDEKEMLVSKMEQMGKEIESLQKEVDALKKSQEKKEFKKFSKRGRQTPADKDKLEALVKWDALDKSVYAISLEQFLIQEFGENSDGSPRVATPTFHGWRGQLKKKGLYPNS